MSADDEHGGPPHWLLANTVRMELLAEVAQLGMIVRKRELWARGHSRYAIGKATAAGLLRPVRRDWVALPGCDPRLIRAVLIGGRLTCISASSMHGLWTWDDNHLHVAVDSRAGHIDPSRLGAGVETPLPARLHWNSDRTPGGTSALDSVPDMLSHIARCQPLHLAVAVFDSAMRTRLISREELEELTLTRDRAFRLTMSHTDEHADSGIESMPRVLLAVEGIPMRSQVVIDGHPVDGLVGDCLILQFDGFGPHSSRAQRNRDLQQDARLMVRGYNVLRFGSDAVVFTPADVVTTIKMAMAEGKHLWPRNRARVGRF